MSRTRKESAGLVASVMLLAGCGSSMPERARTDGPPPIESAAAAVPAVSASAVASAAAAPEPAPSTSVEQEAPPPGKPAAAYKWICSLGQSGGEETFLAVNDDGKDIELAAGPSAAGPFRPIAEEGETKLIHNVLAPKDLKDPDLADTFKAAGVKPLSVTKLTVYGFTVRGGWSFGLGVFADGKGKYLGRFGWGMRLGFARPCAAG